MTTRKRSGTLLSYLRRGCLQKLITAGKLVGGTESLASELDSSFNRRPWLYRCHISALVNFVLSCMDQFRRFRTATFIRDQWRQVGNANQLHLYMFFCARSCSIMYRIGADDTKLKNILKWIIPTAGLNIRLVALRKVLIYKYLQESTVSLFGSSIAQMPWLLQL